MFDEQLQLYSVFGLGDISYVASLKLESQLTMRVTTMVREFRVRVYGRGAGSDHRPVSRLGFCPDSTQSGFTLNFGFVRTLNISEQVCLHH